MLRNTTARPVLMVIIGLTLAGCGGSNSGGPGSDGTGGSGTCGYRFSGQFKGITVQLSGSNASSECSVEMTYLNASNFENTNALVEPVTTMPSGSAVCSGTDVGFLDVNTGATAIPGLQLQAKVWAPSRDGGQVFCESVYARFHCTC